MTGTHWTIIAAALSALALQIGGLHNWHDALTPAFVSGAVLAIGTTIAGIKADPPQSKDSSVPMPRP